MSFNDDLESEMGLSESQADAFYLEQEINDDVTSIRDAHVSAEQLVTIAASLDEAHASFEDRRLGTALIYGALASHGQGDRIDLLTQHDVLVVSNERLKSFLAELYEKIVKALKYIAEAFVELWKRVSDLSSQTVIHAKMIRKMAENRLGRTSHRTSFSVGREINRLVRGNAAPRTGEEVLSGVLETRRQLQVMLVDYPRNVLAAGDRLIRAIGNTQLDAIDYLEGVMAATKALDLDRIASSLRVHAHRDSRFGQGEVVAAPPLPGGKTLFVRIDPKPYRQNPTILSIAEAARTAGLTLDWTDTSPPPPLSSAQMNVFGTNVVIQITTAIISIGDMIYNSRAKVSKEMTDKSRQIARELEKVKSKLESETLTVQDQEIYKAAYRYGLTYARWVTTPLDSYCTHALRVSRAALSVSTQSLRQLI